jgi:arylsulfatase A-like enzyme
VRLGVVARHQQTVSLVLDDVGFADLGCYGSEIATPRMDALAAEGLRYNNFHVTSMCSPTRACLLTGRNAHAVGVGIIAEWSSGFPGYQGRITRRAATLPEILRDHGYATYASGKWHLTNLADYSAAGPHDDWPLGRGFMRWYGFHGALMDHWHPELYEDNHPLHLTPPAGYHLSTDLVERAMAYVRDHVTSTQGRRPFLVYLSFGACHWPHHVPAEFIERCRGRYDVGWDAIREQRLAKQKAVGIVPPDTRLAPRNPGVEPWEALSPDMKAVGTRLQETYAAFLEHTDHEIGRLVDYLAAVGRLDDTAIVLLSDNGASAEGGPTGAMSMRKHYAYEPEPPAMGAAQRERIGGDRSYSHYPWGWAQVSNTPLKWYKKDTHGGGIRAPLIVHWPQRIGRPGAIRPQYHHVIDVLPTLLELLGIQAPERYRGVPQVPIHGTSMAYTFDQPEAPTRKEIQHFELLGDRALWHRGWKAVARHDKGEDFDADRWELYHLDRDFSETEDLAEAQPEKLREMIDLWWAEAEKYGVLPLDDRDVERAQAWLKAKSLSRYEYLPAMARIDRLNAPEISDRSWRVVMDVEAADNAEGVILAWGSRFGGMVVYARDGLVTFEYVYAEFASYVLRALMPVGRARIVLAFTRTGERRGRASLAIDAREVASVEIARTWPTYGPTAGVTCGLAGVPVSEAFAPPFAFSGTIERVVVELDGDGDAGADHFNHVLKEE